MTTKLKDSRILVTGGLGFIGFHLVRRLINEKAHIFILDKSKMRHTPWFREFSEGIDSYSCNLTDLNKLQSIIKDIEPEYIFHLAASLNRERSFSIANEVIQTNVQGTINLMHSLDGISYDRFVYPSTSEVYGNNEAPFREDQMPDPISPYSASKYAAEVFCKLFQKTFGLPIVVLRLFNPYGECQRTDLLIPNVIVSCLLKKGLKMTKGEQTREFNYVEDIVDGMVRAASINGAVGEVINLGSGLEHTVREVAEKIVSMMGNPIKLLFGATPYRKNEIWRMFCDNAKAKHILGWRPRYTLDSGLRKTIRWYVKEFEEDKKEFLETLRSA